MKVELTDAERETLAEHVPYCVTCVDERGDSALGWCKKHMDEPATAVVAARVAEALAACPDSACLARAYGDFKAGVEE